MKKQIVLLVVLLLAAAPAMALIKNSGHDIPTRFGGATDEICVYCHTPHAATDTPLWNRAATGTMPSDVYSSGTLNATMPGNYNATDALLCMSCHDGATQMDAVVNSPNSGDALATNKITGNPNLGDGTWTNDHPIGFSYQGAIDNGDTELVAEATVIATVQLFDDGTNTDALWCSSCHDVHNSGPAAAYALLKVDNAGSNLCFTCHAK